MEKKEDWIEVSPELYDEILRKAKAPSYSLTKKPTEVWIGGGLPTFLITYTTQGYVDKIFKRLG